MLYRPALHDLQSFCPLLFCHQPLGHALHPGVLPLLLYLPAAHLGLALGLALGDEDGDREGDDVDGALVVLSHDDFPSELCVQPAGHSLQSLFPSWFWYRPALHFVHADWPFCVLYLPNSHSLHFPAAPPTLF